MRPPLTRDDRALVADQQNDLRIGRVDPDVLIVVAARRAAQPRPGLAAVASTHGHDAGDCRRRPDSSGRRAAPADRRRRCASAGRGSVGDAGPGLAAHRRSDKICPAAAGLLAAVVAYDASRIARRDRDVDLHEFAGRPLRQLLPGACRRRST